MSNHGLGNYIEPSSLYFFAEILSKMLMGKTFTVVTNISNFTGELGLEDPLFSKKLKLDPYREFTDVTLDPIKRVDPNHEDANEISLVFNFIIDGELRSPLFLSIQKKDNEKINPKLPPEDVNLDHPTEWRYEIDEKRGFIKVSMVYESPLDSIDYMTIHLNE